MRRAELGLLGALFAAHLVASMALVPGHLSVDECTYHLMTKSLVQHGELRFRNGYEEFESIELVPVSVVAHGGHLYPVTPPIHAVLAAPFYAALGYPGLFLLNNLAFLATLALTGALAGRLFRDRSLALGSVLVLAGATFLWEYSQASWPHALATLLVLGAFASAWRGFESASDGRAFGWCLLAGAIGGLGIGVRLDAALALPCLLVPFLFAPLRRGVAASGVIVGVLPALAVLAWANQEKFGIASPLSYGPSPSRSGDWTHYLPVAVLGLAVLGIARLAASPGVRARAARLPGGWRGIAGVALLALGAMAWVPAWRDLVGQVLSGTAQLVWDLRWLPLDHDRPALARTPGGGLLYFGHLKKSLLQSLPYLGVLILPALAVLRGVADSGRLAALALVPGAFLAAYGYFAWDGGMVLNLRYLAPTLPFLAILSAWSLREVFRGIGVGHPAPIVGAWLIAAAWWLWLRPHFDAPNVLEPRLLVSPLVLAVGVAALSLWLSIRGDSAGRPARLSLAALSASALAWASLTAFTYDFPAARDMRTFNLQLGERARESVEPGSIVFTTHPDPFCLLLEADDVHLALPFRDRFRDLRPLVDFQLERGRRVYGAFPPRLWSRVRREQLDSLEVEPLWEHPIFHFRRIVPE